MKHASHRFRYENRTRKTQPLYRRQKFNVKLRQAPTVNELFEPSEHAITQQLFFSKAILLCRQYGQQNQILIPYIVLFSPNINLLNSEEDEGVFLSVLSAIVLFLTKSRPAPPVDYLSLPGFLELVYRDLVPVSSRNQKLHQKEACLVLQKGTRYS